MSDNQSDATWTGDPSQASSDTPSSVGTRDDQNAPYTTSSSRDKPNKNAHAEDAGTTASPDVASTSQSKASGKKVKKGKGKKGVKSAQSASASGDKKKKKKKKKLVAKEEDAVTGEGTQTNTQEDQIELGSADEARGGEFDDPDYLDDSEDSDAYWDRFFLTREAARITAEHGYEGSVSASDQEGEVGLESVPALPILESIRLAERNQDERELTRIFAELDDISGQLTDLHFPQ